MNRMARHDRRDGVLIDELGVAIASKQQTEVVEPGDDPLKLDAIDQEDRKRDLVFSYKIQKRVLQVLRAL